MRWVVALSLAVMVAWFAVAVAWARTGEPVPGLRLLRGDVQASDLSLSVQSPPTRIQAGQTISYLFVVSNPGPGALENVAVVVTWPAALRPTGTTQGGAFACQNTTAGTGESYRYLSFCTLGFMPPGRGYIFQPMLVTNLAHEYVTVHASVISASDEAYWPNNAVDLSLKVGD